LNKNDLGAIFPRLSTTRNGVHCFLDWDGKGDLDGAFGNLILMLPSKLQIICLKHEFWDRKLLSLLFLIPSPNNASISYSIEKPTKRKRISSAPAGRTQNIMTFLALLHGLCRQRRRWVDYDD
jgi:hypothetical protein